MFKKKKGSTKDGKESVKPGSDNSSKSKSNPWGIELESATDNVKQVTKFVDAEYNRQFSDSAQSLENSSDAEEFRRIYAGYGIYFMGSFSENAAIKAEPFSPEKREQFAKEHIILKDHKLASDVFSILSIHGKTLNEGEISIEWNFGHGKRVAYRKHAVQYQENGKWKFAEAVFDKGKATFKVQQLTALCMLYGAKTEKHTISPKGNSFVSQLEKGVIVNFPAKAVSQNQEIEFEIIPVEFPKTSDDDEEDILSGHISGLTYCLTTRHVVFDKPITIELPFNYVKGYSDDGHDDSDIEWKYMVLKLDENKNLTPIQLEPKVGKGKASIQVTEFSGYSICRYCSTTSLSTIVTLSEESYGFKYRCKILFFVQKNSLKSFTMLLTCIERSRIKETIDKRQSDGFKYISKWKSRDLFLNSENTGFSIDVKGKLRLPRSAAIKHPKLTFEQIAVDNFSRFSVEVNQLSPELCGVLTIRDRKGVIDEIHYDPASSKEVHTSDVVKKPVERSGHSKLSTERRGNSRPLPVSRPTSDEMTSFPTVDVNKKENTEQRTGDAFLNDVGLLNLSEYLDDNDLFQVCIRLKMTLQKHAEITSENSIPSKRNVTLLSHALECTTGNPVTTLLKALRDARKNQLADKVEQLWQRGQLLSDIKP